MNRSLYFLTAMSCAVLLAGCTTAETAAPKPSPSASAMGVVTTQDPNPDGLPDPNPKGRGIIQTTTMTSVDLEPGEVVARGTVAAPAGASGTALVTVSWVDQTNSSVYVRGETLVEVIDGEPPVEWEIRAVLQDGAQNVNAVLGAVLLDEAPPAAEEEVTEETGLEEEGEVPGVQSTALVEPAATPTAPAAR